MKAYDTIPEEGKRSSPHAEPLMFLGPVEGIGDLLVLHGRDDEGFAYSCSFWYPNDDEVALIQQNLAEGKRIVVELMVVGEGHPPVAVNII